MAGVILRHVGMLRRPVLHSWIHHLHRVRDVETTHVAGLRTPVNHRWCSSKPTCESRSSKPGNAGEEAPHSDRIPIVDDPAPTRSRRFVIPPPQIIPRNVYRELLIGAILAGGAWFLIRCVPDLNSPVQDIFRRIAFLLDPETAHDLVIFLAKNNLLPVDLDVDDVASRTSLCGGRLQLQNPVGLAAGFDKDAEGALAFLRLGFGFVEVGTVTPLPQPGNPEPRIFRLAEDQAVINRCGFNSKGFRVAEQNLKKLREAKDQDPLTRQGLIGVNLGKNKESTHPERDIAAGVECLGKYADYLVINVSSPNTPGLRALQAGAALRGLIQAAQREIAKLPNDPPLFVKIAPDLSTEEMREIASVLLETKADGVIVGNTTVTRPPGLLGRFKGETGGLSGAPLKARATECVRLMHELTKGKISIIGCGGIFTGKDALDKIESGASAVQIYTGFVYRGAAAARRIKSEISYLLYRGGHKSLMDRIGAGATGSSPKDEC